MKKYNCFSLLFLAFIVLLSCDDGIDLAVSKEKVTVYLDSPEKTARIKIESGNGGYTIINQQEDVFTANIVDSEIEAGSEIEITPLSRGEGLLVLTDRKHNKISIAVNVKLLLNSFPWYFKDCTVHINTQDIHVHKEIQDDIVLNHLIPCYEDEGFIDPAISFYPPYPPENNELRAVLESIYVSKTGYYTYDFKNVSIVWNDNTVFNGIFTFKETEYGTWSAVFTHDLSEYFNSKYPDKVSGVSIEYYLEGHKLY